MAWRDSIVVRLPPTPRGDEAARGSFSEAWGDPPSPGIRQAQAQEAQQDDDELLLRLERAATMQRHASDAMGESFTEAAPKSFKSQDELRAEAKRKANSTMGRRLFASALSSDNHLEGFATGASVPSAADAAAADAGKRFAGAGDSPTNSKASANKPPMPPASGGGLRRKASSVLMRKRTSSSAADPGQGQQQQRLSRKTSSASQASTRSRGSSLAARFFSLFDSNKDKAEPYDPDA